MMKIRYNETVKIKYDENKIWWNSENMMKTVKIIMKTVKIIIKILKVGDPVLLSGAENYWCSITSIKHFEEAAWKWWNENEVNELCLSVG